MRSFHESTARNLLRRPLVLGVPMIGLALLSSVVLAINFIGGNSQAGNLIALGSGLIGYLTLRVFTRFAKNGWEEVPIFWIEKAFSKPGRIGHTSLVESPVEIHSPDTMTELDLIGAKEALGERIRSLKARERLNTICCMSRSGAEIFEFCRSGHISFEGSGTIEFLSKGIFKRGSFVYSLYSLPVLTDPTWLFAILTRQKKDLTVITSFRGIHSQEVKKRVELSRRRTSGDDSPISDIDAEVTFLEATSVLTGLSSGTESLVEASVLIISAEPLELDSELFCQEKNWELPVFSALGIRERLFRSHIVRSVTATDLIPNILDPKEAGVPILKTLREGSLYFDPQDGRLEALHWLVVGASGSGKSFFTGTVLKRVLEGKAPMSVLFLDHNRSFRRFIRNGSGAYLEPRGIEELAESLPEALGRLDHTGGLAGVEFSDLSWSEKKPAARLVLAGIEEFLRSRMSFHPVYVVLDECWNFLRDEPVLVQRAFREFRKLNGAAIAITQSLSDFLTDETGKSIFQNTPIRILLRQGEDLSDFRTALGLNEVELSRVSSLRQEKGRFSECLIKTPFLSRIGRLYPTEEEHNLFRTDNLRAEYVREALSRRSLSSQEVQPCI